MQYLEPHQTRERAPTEYEDLLADGLEKAFAAGIEDIAPLCESLNRDCVPAPSGARWTPELLQIELKRLGA